MNGNIVNVTSESISVHVKEDVIEPVQENLIEPVQENLIEPVQEEVKVPVKKDIKMSEQEDVKEVVVVQEDVQAKYESLFEQGKRNLMCKEVQLAVNQLQEACSLVSSKYGEMGYECADVFYQYGVALLELSRMESGVLGNALEGIAEDEESAAVVTEDTFVEQVETTEEEKEKLSEEILDAMIEGCREKEEAEKPSSNLDSPAAADVRKMENVVAVAVADGVGDIIDRVTVKSSSDNKAVVAVDPEAKSRGDDPEVKVESEVKVVDDEESDSGSRVDDDKEKKLGGREAEMTVKLIGEGVEEDDGGEDEEEGEDEEMEGDDGEEGEKEGTGEDETAENTSQTEEDEVSNIQLAWEMLELAKTIFKKREDSSTEAEEKKRMARLQADCLMRLAEVEIESAQYVQAIEDLTHSRTLLLATVQSGDSDRSLAEVSYQLGVTYTFADLYDEAIDSFSEAVRLVENKMASIRRELLLRVNGGGENPVIVGGGENPVLVGGENPVGGNSPIEREELEKELIELSELLPEIKNKIEDALDAKKSASEIREENGARGSATNSQEINLASSSATTTTTTTTIGFGENNSGGEKGATPIVTAPPTNDISHLVRKKRKPESDGVSSPTSSSSSQDDAKKPKVALDESSQQNGTSIINRRMSSVLSGITENPEEDRTAGVPLSSTMTTEAEKLVPVVDVVVVGKSSLEGVVAVGPETTSEVVGGGVVSVIGVEEGDGGSNSKGGGVREAIEEENRMEVVVVVKNGCNGHVGEGGEESMDQRESEPLPVKSLPGNNGEEMSNVPLETES